jgi:hypothetical protein
MHVLLTEVDLAVGRVGGVLGKGRHRRDRADERSGSDESPGKPN